MNGATFSGGEIRMGSPPKQHYKMTVDHSREYGKPVLEVRCPSYDSLITFVKQLENLQYALITIERVSGSVPEIAFSD